MHYIVRYSENPDELMHETPTKRVQRRMNMLFKKGWSVKEIAEKLEIDANDIDYLLKGDMIDLDILAQVCEAMGISMIKIMSEGVYEFRFNEEA